MVPAHGRTVALSRIELAVCLGLLSLAQLLTALHFNIVVVALPEIARDFGLSESSQQWVFSAYSVSLGSFLLLGGRASDLIGRRRMFIFALVLFGLGSLAGGLSRGAGVLIASRITQGIGGAFLFPATLSLLYGLFPQGPERNRALAVWSLVSSTGLIAGSIIGGTLVSGLGWPASFFLNVPLTSLIGIGAFVCMPSDSSNKVRRSFDLFGVITSTAGVALLIIMLVQLPSWGWNSERTVFTAASAAVALATFGVIECAGADPLMPPALLRRNNLAIAMALAFMFMGTFMAVPYFLTKLFQIIYLYNPLHAGFAFIVPSIAIMCGTQIGGLMATRIGATPALLISLSVGAFGTALLGFEIGTSAGYWGLVPGLILFGLGQGATWPVIWVTSGLASSQEERGIASSMTATSMWIGGATGLAILVAVSQHRSSPVVDGKMVVTIVGTQAAIFAAAFGIFLSLVLAIMIKQNDMIVDTVHTRTG
jgi:MFS family permease